MQWIEGLIFLTGIYPLATAWWANRHTTLVHALSWTLAAWVAWASLMVLEGQGAATAGRYFALCLTGCAGIAVLGARRPIVGAWNFVLIGLLTVLLLPLAEKALLGTPLLDPLRFIFVSGTLAVGVLNYLPTRLAGPVILAGLGSAGELYLLLNAETDAAWQAVFVHVGRWLLPLACWAGWSVWRRSGPARSEIDRQWLKFRDRYGLMWGQRVREQFNQAARYAGWPVYLRWSGLRRTSRGEPLTAESQTAMLETLSSLFKRFDSASAQRDSKTP